MKKWYTLLSLSAVLGLAALGMGSPSGDGAPEECHGPIGMELHMEMIAAHTHFEAAMKELGFSEEQKAATMKIVSDRHETFAGQLKSVALARADLFLAVHGETLDEQGVRDTSRRVAAAEEELNVTKARIAAEVHALLTEDQRTKGKAMLKGWHASFLQRINDHGDTKELMKRHGKGHGSFLEALKDHFHGEGSGHDGSCPHGHGEGH